MSISSKIDTPPKDDAEWARDTTDRLDNLEHPVTARIGPWVLGVQQGTGRLLASHVGGGSIVLANVPEAGADPDEVIELPTEEPYIPTRADWDLSTCSVRKSAAQAVGNASFQAITFPTADWDLRQDGSSAQADGTGITIRDAGVYTVEVVVQFANNATGIRLLSVDVTGAAGYDYDTRLPPGGSDPTILRAVFSRSFAAGDTIRAFAFQNSGGNLNVDTARTRMSANMIRRA